MSGCSDEKPAYPTPPPNPLLENTRLTPDTYVLFQGDTHDYIQIIEGSTNGLLDNFVDLQNLGGGVVVNETLKIIYREEIVTYNGLSYNGTFCDTGIYGFPWTIRNADGAGGDLVILGVDGNGMVRFCYENQSFTLDNLGGRNLKLLSTRIAAYNYSSPGTFKANNGTTYTRPVYTNFTVRCNTTFGVSIFGIYKKSDYRWPANVR